MKEISYSKAFEIDRSVDEVFPLFSPEGEKLWVPGWDYENIMETTELREGYVFLTKTHDHAADDAIWVVSKYEPGRHYVQFYKVEPKEKVGVIIVQCESVNSGTTRVNVSYRYIAITESGNRFISEFNEAVYGEFINSWKKLLTNYFESKG